MTPKAREMLKQLATFLLEGDRHARNEVWKVLTALRGPDAGTHLLKDDTTVPIRRAFLELAGNRKFEKFLMTNLAPVKLEGRDYVVTKRLTHDSMLPHFYRHIRDAVNVLGIPCEEIEKEDSK